jgi:hypothetical protein
VPDTWAQPVSCPHRHERFVPCPTVELWVFATRVLP